MMKAETLIGTVLGSCTLQKVLGQGGMGAVFLAQQSRPRRQVAVKVLLPMTPLNPHQLAAFLERFRRETDAAAALEHQNIIPIYEYGEHDGIAYIVMPYISGGTLRDTMERDRQLPLTRIVNHLDQLAAALDFAHAYGVIHRDIKPANILVTQDGRLLLSDFGLVKITTDAQQIRLTGVGAPVGTPDYMAPEQVIGDAVDLRADLYSLGVILYQMVTGRTPFIGETPMQIAAQHLQLQPPSPQSFRPELPIAAEQVILRALAKKPADRYNGAQELAEAFRATLIHTGLSLMTAALPRLPAASKLSTGQMPVIRANMHANDEDHLHHGGSGLLSRTGRFPAINKPAENVEMSPLSDALFEEEEPQQFTGGGLLSRTGLFPSIGKQTGSLTMPEAPHFPHLEENIPVTGQVPAMRKTTGTGTLSPLERRTNTGSLVAPDSEGNMKLTGPVKVVKVPVAGQPGRFVTGLLPVTNVPTGETVSIKPDEKPSHPLPPWLKWLLSFVVICVVIGLGTSIVLPMLQMPQTNNPTQQQNVPVDNQPAGQNGILVSDPLRENIHGWLDTPSSVYAFRDGAYHISVNGNNGSAALLQKLSFDQPVTYTLTMQQIKGDENSPVNSYGMIFRYNQAIKDNKPVSSFYSFEISNHKGGEYLCYKYDDTKQGDQWEKIWSTPFGDEFKQGTSANTVAIAMQGDTFTITVNGKQLEKTIKDGSYANGMVGMVVNLKDAEVAFSNLEVKLIQ